MDKLAFTLIGMILAFSLTFFKERWFQKKKNQKDAEYLSIIIICMLETFVDKCAAVVTDNGTCYGQYAEDGTAHPQVDTPDFEPNNAKVEWKSLPSSLMYGILTLPIDIVSSNDLINSVSEHVAHPPDYEEYFEERQYQYSKLGLRAIELSKSLRKLCNLPERECTNWDSGVHMLEQIQKIEAHRKKREALQISMIEELKTTSNVGK